MRVNHVNLLLLSDDNEQYHYCCITSMSKLIAHRTKHRGSSFVCAHCCHPYTSEVAYNNHFPACSKNLRQVIRFPNEKHDTIEFKHTWATEFHPYVIYADFECCLKPSNEEQVGTYALNSHEVSGFCLFTVSHSNKNQREPVVYSGDNAMKHFWNALLIEQQFICGQMRKHVSMLPLASDQKVLYDSSTSCPYCKKVYTDRNYKVKHHSHESGIFTNPCCTKCNLAKTHKYRKAAVFEREMHAMVEMELGYTYIPNDNKIDYYQIPVIMHNFKGYDSHFIIKNFDKKYVEQGDGTFKDVRITASNSESFISLDMNNMRFIDSCQFLKAPLNTLVTNLEKGCTSKYDLFVHTKRHTNGNKLLF